MVLGGHFHDIAWTAERVVRACVRLSILAELLFRLVGCRGPVPGPIEDDMCVDDMCAYWCRVVTRLWKKSSGGLVSERRRGGVAAVARCGGSHRLPSAS